MTPKINVGFRLSEETGYPVKAYYGDTAQIANDPDVDFVVAAVKAPAHREALLPVIQPKKLFFIEWPAGKNLQETKELAEAARQNGVRSLVGLQGRQSPVINKAKELVASGKIGKVLSCSVIAATHQELLAWGPLVRRSVTYTTDSSLDGTLLDIGLGHHLDTLLYTLGSEFTSVSATTATLYPTATLTQDDGTPTDEMVTSNAADHIALHGTLADGTFVSVSFRGGYKSTPGRLQLIWVVDGDAGSVRLEGSGPGAASLQIYPPKLYLDGDEVEVESDNYLMRMLASQFTEFAKGEEGRYVTLDDAVKMREWLDAIARSGEKRIDL